MKVLLLGIGNILFGDEGIGVHFIHYIEKKYRFEGKNSLDIMDGGTLAQRLIPIIVEYDHLIIIDTINAPQANAGELYFFDFEAIPNTIDWQGSAHEVEMLHTLNLMNLAGDRPATMIMGIVPTVIEIMDFALSDGVRNAVALMEETLVNYLKTLEIEAIEENNITIDSVISNTLR